MPEIRLVPKRVFSEYDPRPSSVKISRSWHDRTRKAANSPFAAVDIEKQTITFHNTLERYLDRPVALLMDVVRVYPWFIEKSGWLITQVKHSKKNGCLPHKNRPYSLTLHPEFLRYSEEQFLDFVDFLLFPDVRSETRFLTTFSRLSILHSPKKKILRQKKAILPSGEDHQDIESIGRHIEKKYMPHIRATYRWAQNVSLRTLGTFRLVDIQEYYVTINPAFNDSSMPTYVLEHLIFHELLHAYFRLFEHRDINFSCWNGDGYIKSRPHCKVFRKAEASSPHYEAYKKWKEEKWREFALRRKKEWQLKKSRLAPNAIPGALEKQQAA